MRSLALLLLALPAHAEQAPSLSAPPGDALYDRIQELAACGELSFPAPLDAPLPPSLLPPPAGARPGRLRLEREGAVAEARALLSPALLRNTARDYPARSERLPEAGEGLRPPPLLALDLHAYSARWTAESRMRFSHASLFRTGGRTRAVSTWPHNGKDFFTRTSFLPEAVYVRYRADEFTATLGRERLCWGGGFSGSLILSDTAGPLDLVRIEGRPLGARAQAFVAQVDALPPSPADATPVPVPAATARYLAGHRIEAGGRHWTAAVSETVLFTGRFAWAYANPLLPYMGAQHLLRRNDNILFALDAEGRIPVRARALGGIALYAQGLIDDVKLWETRPHETGWLAGLRLHRIAGVAGLSLRAEAVQTSRRAYTHHVAAGTQADSRGRALGYPEGPDHQAFAAELRYRPDRAAGGVELLFFVRHEQRRDGGVALWTPWAQDPSRPRKRWPWRATRAAWTAAAQARHRSGLSLFARWSAARAPLPGLRPTEWWAGAGIEL